MHPPLGASIRDQWDLDPDFLTVNHGSFGATPREVLAAQRTWQDRMERQPSRFMTTIYPNAIRAAAASLASFLNAGPNDLVFVDNATTGCAAVLRSIAFQPGDGILVLSHAYGAVANIVRFVSGQTGAFVRQVKTPFPDPTEDTLLRAVQDAIEPGIRLAVLDHITSTSAITLPVRRAVAACHAAGVKVLVDGAHAPGQVDVDLTAIGADWYAGNCHKWLCAPKGCGFLHATPDAQHGLHPGTISHGYGKGLLAEFDWTGTTDPSRFLAVEAAIDFHQFLGGPVLRERNQRLAAQGAALVAQHLNTQVGTVGSVAGAMGTVRLPVDHPSPEQALDLRRRLMAAGADAPVHAIDGAVWLRLSAFAYNELRDYERLADIVRTVLQG